MFECKGNMGDNWEKGWPRELVTERTGTKGNRLHLSMYPTCSSPCSVRPYSDTERITEGSNFGGEELFDFLTRSDGWSYPYRKNRQKKRNLNLRIGREFFHFRARVLRDEITIRHSKFLPNRDRALLEFRLDECASPPPKLEAKKSRKSSDTNFRLHNTP